MSKQIKWNWKSCPAGLSTSAQMSPAAKFNYKIVFMTMESFRNGCDTYLLLPMIYSSP